MTRLQQIATLIKELTHEELLDFAGDYLENKHPVSAHQAYETAVKTIARMRPDPTPSQPATVKTMYEYSGVKYDLKAMNYPNSSQVCGFEWNETPQGYEFWEAQQYGTTNEGQSYLDDMAVQYAREQKECGK
jgi:hypothetical protein